MPHTKLSWDWKDHPELEELETALRPFGVHVYEDPVCEGSDTFGFIFSSEALNRTRLAAIAKEDEEEDETEEL